MVSCACRIDVIGSYAWRSFVVRWSVPFGMLSLLHAMMGVCKVLSMHDGRWKLPCASFVEVWWWKVGDDFVRSWGGA